VVDRANRFERGGDAFRLGQIEGDCGAGPDLAGGRRLPRVAQPGNATVNLM